MRLKPKIPCKGCGKLKYIYTKGYCAFCYEKSPERRRQNNLAVRRYYQRKREEKDKMADERFDEIPHFMSSEEEYRIKKLNEELREVLTEKNITNCMQIIKESGLIDTMRKMGIIEPALMPTDAKKLAKLQNCMVCGELIGYGFRGYRILCVECCKDIEESGKQAILNKIDEIDLFGIVTKFYFKIGKINGEKEFNELFADELKKKLGVVADD